MQEFEKLFRKFRPGLVYFARNFVQSQEDSEEIVHDMFLAVWEKRDQLMLDNSLKNYLFTGVKNRCLNHIKKASLPLTDLNEDYPLPSLDASVLDQLNLKETQNKINFLIDQLPPKCKMVFLLSRMQELSYKEIAAVMDISPKTVENQIGIALKFLKDGMGISSGGIS